ncbi:F-box/WD repeat-containing protein 12 [Plecturocebus cupreus]
MEIRLPDLALSRIFSFLDVFSLLQVSQVNKVKGFHLHCPHAAASHTSVTALQKSRRTHGGIGIGLQTAITCGGHTLCRDGTAATSLINTLGAHTWKQFFLHQRRKEASCHWHSPDNLSAK